MDGIQDEQDDVRRRDAGHTAGEHVDGDAGVLGVGGEGVDAGEIDAGQVGAADALHAAGVVLDGDAGVVGYLVAEAGEAVEEGGLAAVGGAAEG